MPNQYGISLRRIIGELTARVRMGYHVDGVKFAGGSFSLFPEDKLRELIELAHHHGAYVSTVGFYVLLYQSAISTY